MTRYAALLCSATLFATSITAAAQAPGAASPAATQTTQVLVTLTVKPPVDRAKLMATMPQEVRETVQLYLDGKIQQWFSRSDGSGVVFIVNAGSVADAKAVIEALPLAKAGLATFDYVGLGPLKPLAMLIAPARGAEGAGQK